MELFRSNKLIVNLSDNNVLEIKEKTGSFCLKTEQISYCNLSDVLDMQPQKHDRCVSLATMSDDYYLKMNKQAVAQLMDRWNTMAKIKQEVLFEKPKVTCAITENGYLIFKEKEKRGLFSCSSPSIRLLSIPLNEIIIVDTLPKILGSDKLFMCTSKHAIEVGGLDEVENVKKRIVAEAKKRGSEIHKSQKYERAIRLFVLNRKEEYIFTTPKGIAHYFRNGFSNSEYSFNPWDVIVAVAGDKGWLRRKIMIVGEIPFSTQCHFPADSATTIIEYVNKHLRENAGKGEMFGKGKNKVYVTDSHVVCIGNKEIIAHRKPYEDGKLIKKCCCSSIVSLNGFQVKVGRYDWKAFCCIRGRLYYAVTAEPNREYEETADKHRY